MLASALPPREQGLCNHVLAFKNMSSVEIILKWLVFYNAM
jgi:hypothetical protein